jgi:hypothetical protein
MIALSLYSNNQANPITINLWAYLTLGITFMLLIPCNLPTCFKLTYHKFAVCVTCTLLHASNLFTVSLQPPIKCVCVQSAVLNMQPVHVPSHVHICVDLFANYIFHICIHSNHQGRVWWDPLLLLEAQPLCNPSNNHKRPALPLPKNF